MPEEPFRRSRAFRAQHRELLALVYGLRDLLDVAGLEADATRARTLLAMLAGKLRVHLSMEDKAFFARLPQHKSASVRELASALMADMNAIHAAFEAYFARWPTAQAIQANAPQFVSETQQIFEALATRIHREHDLLFPALDHS